MTRLLLGITITLVATACTIYVGRDDDDHPGWQGADAGPPWSDDAQPWGYPDAQPWDADGGTPWSDAGPPADGGTPWPDAGPPDDGGCGV